jgi:DNA-binding MarR family transcriptional regulator
VLRAQTQADAWADAASAALGVNRTDFACLRALYAEQPCTAGRLAEVTGLTTGAVTGVLDRVEKAGFVVRGSDPDDRRKVVIQLSRGRLPALESILRGVTVEPAAPGVVPFLLRQSEFLRDETARLRRARSATVVSAGPEGSLAIPLDSLAHAKLEVVGGAMDLDLNVAELPGELLRAELSGPPLRIAEHQGHVRIAHRSLGRALVEDVLRAGSGHRPSGKITLSGAVEWEIRVSGGRNKLNFDLRGARIDAVEIEGGGGDLRFQFGPPEREVSFRVNGGANRIAIERPVETTLEVVARGRIPQLAVDGRDLGALTATAWVSSEVITESHIRVHVRGGANRLAASVT